MTAREHHNRIKAVAEMGALNCGQVGYCLNALVAYAEQLEQKLQAAERQIQDMRTGSSHSLLGQIKEQK